MTRSNVLVALLLGLVLMISGCLPLELSVSQDGKVVIPREEGFCTYDTAKGSVEVIYKAKEEKPVFAQYTPDGKYLLLITAGAGGGMAQEFKVMAGPAGGGKIVKVYSGTNIAYAKWSPDAKYIAITRIGDQSDPKLQSNMPELILANVGEGTSKKVLVNTSTIQRWSSDSKFLYDVQITGKKDSLYVGQIVRREVSTGKGTPLADVIGKDIFLDISPDNATLLFTAASAGKVGQTLKAANETDLFELNIANGTVRSVAKDVSYAMYSPKGTKVLVASGKQDAGKLEVYDSGMTKSTVVASDAALACGDGPTSVSVYPGWFDDDTLLYLRLHAVYGTAGKNLELTTVDAKGAKRTNHQANIDSVLK